MNTEKKQYNSRKLGPFLLTTVLIAAAVIGGIVLACNRGNNDSFPLLKELSELSADRTISSDEYAFFVKLAEKQDIGTEEKDVKNYIAEINAEFYLGSQMGVCEPFSYQVHSYRTEAENKDRAMKKLNGQLYYGPDSFSEESYFEYIHSRLRSDILTWLVAHRDEDMMKAARKFFDRNEKRFAAIKEVTYEVTANGVTEQKVLEDTMFRTMGQSDPTLMDALEKGEIGEERILEDGTGRTVKKLDVVTEVTPFEDQATYVLELWLNNEVLDQLIGAIAENSSLVF